MSTKANPHARTHTECKIHLQAWDNEKECYLPESKYQLGRFDSLKEMLRTFYQNHGPGRYTVKKFGGKIQGIWTGWIKDRGEELLIQVKINEESRPLDDVESFGLDSLDYSVRGEVSIMKEGGA
jgi:hypothetical protein